jgi:hypothetical protein
VRPGNTETVTITTGRSTGVVYDAVYSDGKYGDPPKGYGGNKGGKTDVTGVYRDTFTVATGAPRGAVQVNVGVIQLAKPHAKGFANAYFSVADSAGKCRP